VTQSFTFKEFASREAAVRAAADALADAVAAGISARGAAALALSGGSTPGPAYAELALRNIDWRKVAFGLVDERWVRPDDPSSNEGMIARAAASALGRGARLVGLWSDAGDVAAGAARADAIYAPLHFDAALMGMGEDGHTASWFAGAAGLAAALDPASPHTIVAIGAPQAAGAAARLTLTRAALKRAERLILLITGAEKRRVFDRAIGADPHALPVAALIADGRLAVHWAA
jgi:6-phosphogluconolactonase